MCKINCSDQRPCFLGLQHQPSQMCLHENWERKRPRHPSWEQRGIIKLWSITAVDTQLPGGIWWIRCWHSAQQNPSRCRLLLRVSLCPRRNTKESGGTSLRTGIFQGSKSVLSCNIKGVVTERAIFTHAIIWIATWCIKAELINTLVWLEY